MRRNLSMDNIKKFTTTKNNVFGQDRDHRHPQRPLMTSTYQADYMKNRRTNLGHIRHHSNIDVNTIYNSINAQHRSAKNSVRNDYIADDDYPKPQTIHESNFEWPPKDSKKILTQLKLRDSRENLNVETGEEQDFNPDDNHSNRTKSCRKLDIPAHYGAYSNKPLNTMLNPNHHKTIRSTHGKYFKNLTPWKDAEKFRSKL